MSAESDYTCPKCGYEWCAIPPSECPKCSTHSHKRVVRVLPGVPERVETGAVQFGDDWPGVFIRGDNAGYYALCLKSVLEGNSNPIATHVLTGLQETLASCIQGSAGQLLKMHPNEKADA